MRELHGAFAACIRGEFIAKLRAAARCGIQANVASETGEVNQGAFQFVGGYR